MDFTAILKTVAPWLATAATGPLGGMAVEAIGNALGTSDRTIDGVKAALQGATAEDMRKLKEADQAFQVQMQELNLKSIEALEALAVDDRKSAREMQVANKSMVPAILTWFVVGSFVGALAGLFIWEIPATNKEIVVYMAGQLSGFAAAAVAFWLGTTRSSEDKTHMLAKANPVK